PPAFEAFRRRWSATLGRRCAAGFPASPESSRRASPSGGGLNVGDRDHLIVDRPSDQQHDNTTDHGHRRSTSRDKAVERLYTLGSPISPMSDFPRRSFRSRPVAKMSRPVLYDLFFRHQIEFGFLMATVRKKGKPMPGGKRRPLRRGVVVVGAFAALAWSAAYAKDSTAYVKDAEQYIVQGNLKAAEIELRNAIREAPQDPVLR